MPQTLEGMDIEAVEEAVTLLRDEEYYVRDIRLIEREEGGIEFEMDVFKDTRTMTIPEAQESDEY